MPNSSGAMQLGLPGDAYGARNTTVKPGPGDPM